MNARFCLLAFGGWFVLLGGCGGETPAPPPQDDAEPAAAPTNRVDVPPAVRRNLGITFSPVERRHVEATTRAPGRFESLPDAHQHVGATLAGRVQVLVAQYDRVEAGAPLFRLDAPAWREMQATLYETIADIRHEQAEREGLDLQSAALATRIERVQQQRDVWAERLRTLGELATAGGGVAGERTAAQAELAALESSLAEIGAARAELAGRRLLLDAQLAAHAEAAPDLFAEARGDDPSTAPSMDIALLKAAALLGTTAEALRERVQVGGVAVPRWRTVAHVEVRARRAGVVEAVAVTDDSWVEAGAAVIELVDPQRLRFRAFGLQADLGRLSDGMPGRILPPDAAASLVGQSVPAIVRLGLEADAPSRRIDLIATPTGELLPEWVREGIACELEIVLATTGEPAAAIPLAAVIQDGLQRILFRRDPKAPDKVIRMEADLGLDDGRWVVVESGLMEGDEVVLDGIYELMLASSTSGSMEGGHFHSDGTFHAGPDH